MRAGRRWAGTCGNIMETDCLSERGKARKQLRSDPDERKVRSLNSALGSVLVISHGQSYILNGANKGPSFLTTPIFSFLFPSSKPFIQFIILQTLNHASRRFKTPRNTVLPLPVFQQPFPVFTGSFCLIAPIVSSFPAFFSSPTAPVASPRPAQKKAYLPHMRSCFHHKWSFSAPLAGPHRREEPQVSIPWL